MANTKITTNVIADDAITTAKIADDAVGNDQLASGLTLGGNTAATLSTAAQPNITSVGTLTSLALSGNITTGGITINGAGSVISDSSDFGISSGGLLTIDVAGDIILDADGGDILFKDGGTHWASLYTNGTHTYLQNMVNSGDIYLSGKDASGNGVNALILDMSAAGHATFNAGATFGATTVVDVGAPSSSDQVLGSFRSQAGREIGFVWDDSASTLGVATITAHDLVFHTSGNSSEKMRITTGGNVGIGTTPFSKFHVKDTGWSSGSPYGTVQLIEGKFVNDQNWGHLIITDEETGTGQGGSIRFATGPDSSLNPFAGIQGAAEGTSYGGLRLLTRPTGGTALERYAIKSTGRHMFYGMDTNSTYSSVAIGHVNEGSTGGYLSSWTNVFAHRLHIRTNGSVSPNQHGTTTFSGSGDNNFRIMQNVGYNGVYWNASTETGRGTIFEMDNGSFYWVNTNSVTSGSQFSNVTLARINTSGNFAAIGTVLGSQSLSDQRLKQDIEDLPSALENVKALRAVTFNWKDEERRRGTKELGLIAQEALKIYPEMVDSTDFVGSKENEETLEKEGEEERYFMFYEKLSVVLLKAMQEQQELIETLQTKVAALENN